MDNGARGGSLPGPAGCLFLVAVTFVAEVGDVRRFATAQQLMAFLGLVPSEPVTRCGAAPLPRPGIIEHDGC